MPHPAVSGHSLRPVLQESSAKEVQEGAFHVASAWPFGATGISAILVKWKDLPLGWGEVPSKRQTLFVSPSPFNLDWASSCPPCHRHVWSSGFHDAKCSGGKKFKEWNCPLDRFLSAFLKAPHKRFRLATVFRHSLAKSSSLVTQRASCIMSCGHACTIIRISLILSDQRYQLLQGQS